MSQFSNFERLSLVLQANASVGNNYFVEPKLVGELITSGHDWALSWEYHWLDKVPHSLDEVVDETVQILDMYSHLQSSADAVGMEPKDTTFPGFDHTNDRHSGVASTLVEQLGRFSHVRGATSNSHSITSIGRYRSMLAAYRPIMSKITSNWPGGNRLLELEEVSTVLNAR